MDRFVESPTQETLNGAREAWKASRRPYLQSEAFRFYSGPIDDADGPEPMINGWPIDEYHIDAVEGAPRAGIINDPKTFPKISKELIERMNERAGETAITSGFHAIEFLLWGQDLSTDGPGNRPVSDFTEALHADRRGEYLLACGESLTDQLEYLVKSWSPGKDNFRTAFETMPPLEAARDLIYGLHVMSGKEMAGERLLVAWDTQDQEDEHSCFSDTTHDDMHYDALGVENVYLGRYRTLKGELIEGPGVKDLAKALMPEEAGSFGKKVRLVRESISRIPVPFDQAILGDDESPGRKTILEAVIHLEDFAAMMADLQRAVVASRG